jgi:hypothetical protein
MKWKALALVAALACSVLVGSAPSGQAAPKPPKPPMVVGTDPDGDWGCNQRCELADLGTELGQELLEASIGMSPDNKIVNFIIKVSALPDGGGVPEISRYQWSIIVDGNPIQISGGFTEYIRGTCNPTYNPTLCPPPRDPGEAPFFLRVGPCTIGTGGLGPCEEIGLVHGIFDPATATITIPVPLEMIDAKPKSTIAPGLGSFESPNALMAVPQAFSANGNSPRDELSVTETFTVPKAKKKKKK